MHNGFVGSWNRLRRKVEAMIPDALYPSRLGTTDSEAVFLAMVGAGIEHDPLTATRYVLLALCELVNESGLPERLRFTSALSNGKDLFAFRFAENDTANSLYFREDGDQVIVVSEPYDKEPDWSEVPANHVLVALAAERAKIVPIFQSNSIDAGEERARSQRVIGRVS
jgi:glutamine amidotransferase